MSAALRELLERACEAYLYSQMRDDRFTAADWMADAFNAAGIPALLAEVERLRAEIVALRRDRGLQQARRKFNRARAETAEAALLAKSAAYDALVARVEAAPVVEMRMRDDDRGKDWLECGDELNYASMSALDGQRVRLLVSDDRPSRTAGEK